MHNRHPTPRSRPTSGSILETLQKSDRTLLTSSVQVKDDDLSQSMVLLSMKEANSFRSTAEIHQKIKLKHNCILVLCIRTSVYFCTLSLYAQYITANHLAVCIYVYVTNISNLDCIVIL